MGRVEIVCSLWVVWRLFGVYGLCGDCL